MDETIRALLEQELPLFFPRADLYKLTNGVIGSTRMANLNHSNQGPPRHFVGRKVFYVKSEFLAWLDEYFGGMVDERIEGFTRVVRRTTDGQADVGEADRGDEEAGGYSEDSDFE